MPWQSLMLTLGIFPLKLCTGIRDDWDAAPYHIVYSRRPPKTLGPTHNSGNYTLTLSRSFLLLGEARGKESKPHVHGS